MSQKASTDLILAEPLEDFIANEPWSIETYADGLMDELFSEIDQILDGGSNLSSQTVQQENIHQLRTVTVQPIVLPETLHHRVQTFPINNNHLSTVVVDTPAVSTVTKSRSKKSRRSLGTLLWLGATVMAIAGAVSLFNSGVFNRLVSKPLQQSLLKKQQVQPKLPTKGQIEADLVNYMLGALAVIDKQEAKSNLRSAKLTLTAVAPSKQTALAYIRPTGKLSPQATNNIPPAPIPSTRVVERIYVPVYQAPPSMGYKLPPIPGTLKPLPLGVTVSRGKETASKKAPVKTPTPLMGTASKKAPVKTALNKVQKQTLPTVRPNIKPVALQATPVTVRQAPKPPALSTIVPSRVVPPKLPKAAPPKAPPTQEIASVAIPAASFSYTLEGLLELGNKSAALFKIEGVTRRIDVGETIGASGWTLVEVAKGEAVIRRNGEVRSIYAGQKF